MCKFVELENSKFVHSCSRVATIIANENNMYLDDAIHKVLDSDTFRNLQDGKLDNTIMCDITNMFNDKLGVSGEFDIHKYLNTYKCAKLTFLIIEEMYDKYTISYNEIIDLCDKYGLLIYVTYGYELLKDYSIEECISEMLDVLDIPLQAKKS